MSSKFKDRVEMGIGPDGTPVYRWATGNTKHELHINIARLVIEAEGWEYFCGEDAPASQEKPGVMFEDYAKDWLETFKLNGLEEKTKGPYKSRMFSLIIPAFRGMRLDEIDATCIQRWLNQMGTDGKAKNTIRDTLNLFKQCMAAALEDKLIAVNPTITAKIKNPSKKVMKRDALTDEQWRDVVLSIPKLGEVNDQRFMALLSYTSMRPGEIYGLRWEDIDLDGKVINVRRAVSFASNIAIVKSPKTAAGVRSIPLPDALAAFLKPFVAVGYVIARENGDPYSEQTHRRAWERIKAAINVFGMTPYNWRHTYATTLMHSGADPDTTRAILGHADVRMTMNYVHTQPHHVAKAGELMNAHFVQVANAL